MQRIGLEIYTTASEAVKILQSVADHKVELEIPSGSVLLDNILNLKIIEQGAKKFGKEVTFSTNDVYGRNLIKILSGEEDEVVVGAPELVRPPTSQKQKIKLPSVPVLPKMHLNLGVKKLGVVLPVIVLLVGILFFMILQSKHKAVITLYFSPQLQTKSVAVKVGDGLKTDAEKKVLSGLKISKTLDASLTANSSGTKLEGEKAKGKVTLYNYTDQEITVKKGTKLTYKNKDTSYIFLTDTEAKVLGSTSTLTDTQDKVITPGNLQVAVTAESIGESYNIKKDKNLEVKGFNTTTLKAISLADFSGGLSKEVKVVTQADITKLENDLSAQVVSQPSSALKNAVPSGYSFIDKSEKVVSKSIVMNNKVGDEKEQLSGSITAQVEGLSYSKSELINLMGKLSQNLVPPGYELHSFNNDIKAEVLGNTEKTVLSSTEADLQVTTRFYIAPKIDKEKIFEQIKGKNLQEADKILAGINGVEKVALVVTPNVSFFQNIPSSLSKVEVQTKIQE